MHQTAPTIPYVIRVGVTGHRQLSDPDGIAEAVARLLVQLRSTLEGASERPFGAHGSDQSFGKRCAAWIVRRIGPMFRVLGLPIPASLELTPPDRRTAIRWVVISPLAKGSDRIVARAMMRTLGAQLEVVTPLPLEEYRKDFADPADLAEFDELLAEDPSVVQLPHRSHDRDQLDVQSIRNRAYMNVGQRVAESCEMLIAVWDGQRAAGHGGTAEAIRFALEQNRKVLWIDANSPEHPARLLSRVGSDEHVPANARLLHDGILAVPMPPDAKSLSLGFHRVSAYNRDNALGDDAWRHFVEESSNAYLTAAHRAGVNGVVTTAIANQIVPHYERATRLAIIYQKLYCFAATWLFRLSAIAITIVAAHTLFFPDALWMIGFEIAAMVSAVVLLWISRSEAWHEKWLSDRRLAESLRSHMYMSLAPTDRSQLPGTGDAAIPFYPGPDNSLIDACQPIVDAVRDTNGDTTDLEPLKRFVIDDWVRGQAAWHRANAIKKKRLAHWYHHIGLILFSLTLFMAVLHILGVGHKEHQRSGIAPSPVQGVASAPAHAENNDGRSLTRGIPWTRLIVFLAIVLPAWAASVHAVANLLDFDRLAARSGRMADVLDQLAGQAEAAATRDELAIYISRAAQIMNAESVEWIASLSFHNLRLPS